MQEKNELLKETREMLTECEKLVALVVWDSSEELSLREITKKANERFGFNWANPTVSTFLAKLVRKGYLTSHRSGRLFLYRVVVSKDEYAIMELRKFYVDYGYSKEKMLQVTNKSFEDMHQKGTKWPHELLTDAERQAALIVWDSIYESEDALCLMEITDKVNQRSDHNWKIQTVSTLLARARKKGCLKMHKACWDKRKYLYYSTISKDEYAVVETRKFISDYAYSKEEMLRLVEKAFEE